MTVDPHEQTAAESIVPGKMQAGRPIGGYDLIEVLGEGGMGVVWRAHDPKLDREIAIKVLKRHDAAPSLRQRLQREARAMARLKHPNVLTVYDAGTEGDRDFIAMELVDGATLDDWLKTQPPDTQILEALLAAGRGLAAAHRAGLVHRDFKPQNVLRSNDGRVLVTDFGLARGFGEESQIAISDTPSDAPATGGLDETLEVTPTPPPAARASTSGVRADSVLHSPLTQTGALIGTPAYMAPEQFRGAAPDPRTDQFAFCVAAWQALTGGRPYTGNSIDELRMAADAGVAHVQTPLLSPTVRAALVRGLDPDPARRWPDLDALLAAIEHAIRPRRPRWLVPVVGLAVVALVGVTVLIARRGERTVVAARICEPADQAFGDAWSPSVRAEIWKDLDARRVGVSDALFARVADPFDDFRTRWMHSYDEACRAAPDKLPKARLGCLLGARDQVGALTYLVRTGTAPRFEQFDAHGILPNLAVCNGPSPVAPPAIPDDKRVRVIAVLANTFALRGRPNLAEAIARLETEANEIGWKPLLPMLYVAAGNEYLRRGQVADARDFLRDRALPSAKAVNDVRLMANIRLGLLEAAMQELEEPDGPFKDGLPRELAVLLEGARAASKFAGDDPLFAGSIATIEANALAEQGRWSFGKREYKNAISAVQVGRRQYEVAGDLRRAARAAAIEAELYLRRADERAFDDALFVARSAEEQLERAKLPTMRLLDEVRARVAFRRGEYAEASRRFAALAPPTPPSSLPEVRGRVITADGAPVPSATVVAWTGDLDGDPAAIVTDRRTSADADVVRAEADGTFVLHAEAGAAILAQTGEGRSVPQVAGAAPVLLKIQPTGAVTGTVDGKNLQDVDAFARYAIGAHTWTLRTPVKRDRTFSLTNLPKGTPSIGATAAVDDGVRIILAGPGATKLVWPYGRALEVVVRGPIDEAATVWVFRGTAGEAAPTTRAQAEARAANSTNVAFAALHPIGATATVNGRAVYARGDRHAVLMANPLGFMLACVAPVAAPTSAVTCKEIEMLAGQITDLADGRYGTDTQPVLFDLR